MIINKRKDKFSLYLTGLSVVVAIAFLTILTGCRSTIYSANPKQPSVYDRVMQTGKIRAAYLTYPPYCMRDPNTGRLSGIFVDALVAAAKNLSLQVDWTEEVGPGSMIEGLITDRYDIVPTGIYPNANRARQADFTVPLFYSGIGVYVRPNDKRFVDNLNKINDKSITIATKDGEVTDVIAKNSFPNAHRLTHAEMSDSAQTLLDVAQNKADLTFAEPGIAALFLKHNPGLVYNIAEDRPIEVFANTMMLKLNESAFKSMLNTALTELLNTGYMEQIISRYEPSPGVYYRIAPPYLLHSKTSGQKH